jgi:hypothetical protein
MLAAGSSAHILLGVRPARTRNDCTRYSARAHNCTVEAQPEALGGPTPVPHVVTPTAARTPKQAKLLPAIEGGGRSMGCHVATAGRLHGHRFFKPARQYIWFSYID